MGYIADEVANAIRDTGSTGCQSSELRSSDIHSNLMQRFTNGRRSGFLWEHFEDAESIQSEDGWRWISEYARGKSCLLSFNPFDEKTVFVFSDGGEVSTVLSECSGFEFYVTDLGYSYALCFNHHDFLIAVGTAKDWLIKRRAFTENVQETD
jgi:hypothetical protein